MLLLNNINSHALIEHKEQFINKKPKTTNVILSKNSYTGEQKKCCNEKSQSVSSTEHEDRTSSDDKGWRIIFPFLQEESTPFVALEKRPSIETLSTCPSELSENTLDKLPMQSILRTKPHFSVSSHYDEHIKHYNSVRFNLDIERSCYDQSEYEKSGDNWYTATEMWEMKMEAIYQYDVIDDDDDVKSEHERSYKPELLTSTIGNVLIVDTHPIYLLLFVKYFRSLMPHAQLTIARSAQEAWTLIQRQKIKSSKKNDTSTASHGFDIIITEERLTTETDDPKDEKKQRRGHITGSMLLQRISREQKNVLKASTSERRSNNDNDEDSTTQHRLSLLIGVSAHLDADRKILEKSGADLTWSKPPPSMNESLRSLLLYTTIKKRRAVISKE